MFCCASIPQSEIGMVQRFGRHVRELSPGLNFVNCFCGEAVAGRLSLRLEQLDVGCGTKTKDNVFVEIKVSVQYQVIREKVYDAYYRLANPQQQMRAYIFDVVRASVPSMELDSVFEVKDEIAVAIKEQLCKAMEDFGFEIVQALVTDIEPDEKVKRSMNEINAAQRLRVAATDKAEAEKILVVKAAEADAESKYLSGVGIARQRKAIVEGLRDSVLTFAENVDGTSPKDVMDLVLITQYFDTLQALGEKGKASTVFIPHGPGTVGQIQNDIRMGFMQAQASHVNT